ncbi:DUF4275 family protein [Hymenobacter jeollabukensis]|uniref:DUF4275 family protein n=1 Tax=Hymenobacter jeollabukensis TaxID=2025313 RepID=A0A5R8WWY7_9BACT|nr:DUF4275 family protein [Hymenobacter jeollabukensis]TLM96573.1 DUF4275 family protein [Hymenobacter jeollabukensis]
MSGATPGRQQWRALLETVVESVEEFGPQELQELKRRWHQLFGGGQQPFLWHCFSFRLHPHLTGAPAVADYEAQPVRAFLVFFEQAAWGFRCRGVRLPPWPLLRELSSQGPPEGRDVYVTQPTLNWVFCQTHEAGFGPYFARADPASTAGMA